MPSNPRILSEREYRQYPLGYHASLDQHRECIIRFTFLTPQLLSGAPIPLSTLYDFCWRTCPIYAIGDYRGIAWVDIKALTNLIVGAWYPYYVPSFGNASPEEKDWKHGDFLVKFIGCWEEGCITSLPEIIGAHGRLCGLVEKGLQMAKGGDLGRKEKIKENHAEWVLRPLFRKIMIVLDKSDWWVEGVLLVAVQQAEPDHAQKDETTGSGPIDLEFLEKEEHTEKVGKGIYRVKIDRAIQVVMELQASEDEANGQVGLRKVGSEGTNTAIGCSVAEWMLENFEVQDYESFGFREDADSRLVFAA